MHNPERDDVAKELVGANSREAEILMSAADALNLRLDQRHPGKPIVCEVVGSDPLELVVVIPGDEGSYTLQALRRLTAGERITLKRRDNAQVVSGTLYRCRKSQRDGGHPNLHLASLKTAPGAF
jgi:hypothetical protein